MISQEILVSSKGSVFDGETHEELRSGRSPGLQAFAGFGIPSSVSGGRSRTTVCLSIDVVCIEM